MFTSSEKEYSEGYKDGQRSGRGETSILEEIGKSVASPFTAMLNPDRSAGEEAGRTDAINGVDKR